MEPITVTPEEMREVAERCQLVESILASMWSWDKDDLYAYAADAAYERLIGQSIEQLRFIRALQKGR